MIFKSKLRKKIETMRSERLYERAELERAIDSASTDSMAIPIMIIQVGWLKKEIKLLDEILSK